LYVALIGRRIDVEGIDRTKISGRSLGVRSSRQLGCPNRKEAGGKTSPIGCRVTGVYNHSISHTPLKSPVIGVGEGVSMCDRRATMEKSPQTLVPNRTRTSRSPSFRDRLVKVSTVLIVCLFASTFLPLKHTWSPFGRHRAAAEPPSDVTASANFSWDHLEALPHLAYSPCHAECEYIKASGLSESNFISPIDPIQCFTRTGRAMGSAVLTTSPNSNITQERRLTECSGQRVRMRSS